MADEKSVLATVNGYNQQRPLDKSEFHVKLKRRREGRDALPPYDSLRFSQSYLISPILRRII